MKGRAVVLIGYMGSGKTTVSKLMGKISGRTVIDSDAYIESRQGRSINEIFAACGEQAFRDMETELLKELVDEGFDGILSCGGGMPLRPQNRQLMRELGSVIFLKADASVIARRLSKDSSRPLLNGLDEKAKEAKVEEMLLARKDAYLAAADSTVDTAEMTAEETAESCLRFFAK